MAFTIIYITFPDAETAKSIGTKLIENKLVACTNTFPIQSSYWWAGNVENENEFVMIAKTCQENYDKVKNFIEKVHPYDVPCIMAIQAVANESYEKWILESTS